MTKGRQASRTLARDGRTLWRCAALVLSLFITSWPVVAQPQHADHSLGSVDFSVSCAPAVQADFKRGVALLHHMTYPQAREAFEHVAAADSTCGMAQWGVAMTLFQPLWPTRPGPDALRRGWHAIERAKAANPKTEREALFIAAAEAFFLEPSSTDYALRIRRWERAAQAAHDALPHDVEAAAFYALAHLAVAQLDSSARGNAARAAKVLLTFYERKPEHPGLMHYLIHANDVGGREREALDVTRRYDALAPRNPHALHMPTHIYTRLGEWKAVIAGNLRAAAAALEHPAGDRGEFVWDEFPHAIEYLVYAHLQRGEDDEALAQLRRLKGTARLEPTFKTAFHIASTQARYALERHAWSEAAAIIPREYRAVDWDRFAWPEAVSHFARGFGAARTGNVDVAIASVDRLRQLEVTMEKAGETLFARNIRMLHLELSAWLAHLNGADDRSLSLMREAAELEVTTPKHAVTPAPTIPAYELLGDLALAQKQPTQALDAYKRSLQFYPRRFNSLLGAARAARDAGDVDQARGYYARLLEVAADGTRSEVIREARKYLAQ